MSLRKEEIKKKFIKEHKMLESMVIQYIKSIMPEYKKDLDKYLKHVNSFISNIESFVKPHFEFEEDVIFPLISDNSLIKELLDEHISIKSVTEEIRKVKTMNEKIKLLEKLIEMLYAHLHKENDRLIPLLEKS